MIDFRLITIPPASGRGGKPEASGPYRLTASGHTRETRSRAKVPNIILGRTMRASHAYFLFIGTLFTAAGYGATFLLTEHFRALGGSELDTSTTLAGAMVGTLVGVPLVGWYAKRLRAARMG